MTAMAARSLGYHVRVLDPEPDCAARPVSDETITAAFDDQLAAAELGSKSDVITLEIEKIALSSLRAAALHAPTRPGAELLEIVQDRGKQKQWLADHGFPLGDWRPARSESELAAAAGTLGTSYAKRCTGGYDGRGQVLIDNSEQAATAWRALGSSPLVVERALDLEIELSVMVARSPAGEIRTFPVARNHHEQRILAWSVIPAPVDAKVAAQAESIATRIAREIGLEGILAVELFLPTDGRLLVNELAPRPHNSFHATERACVVSQFEQHVRAICNLPLGDTSVITPAAIVNLLGDLWADGPPPFERALALPGVGLHLYGKRGARPGRKMGHLSAIGSTPEEAVARAQEAIALLE
jgi:5-(carboxyamino)imidazole ribonucleotide synthase